LLLRSRSRIESTQESGLAVKAEAPSRAAPAES
jgi:hypothetical protein